MNPWFAENPIKKIWPLFPLPSILSGEKSFHSFDNLLSFCTIWHIFTLFTIWHIYLLFTGQHVQERSTWWPQAIFTLFTGQEHPGTITLKWKGTLYGIKIFPLSGIDFKWDPGTADLGAFLWQKWYRRNDTEGMIQKWWWQRNWFQRSQISIFQGPFDCGGAK